MAATGVWKPLVSEPKPGDSIVEVPSMVVPLLSKSQDIPEQTSADDDEVQIISQHKSNFKNVDEYVKASYVAALTKKGDRGAILALKNYHQSSAGQLLLDIGLKRAFELDLGNKARKLSYRIKKTTEDKTELIDELESIKKELVQCRESNKPFKSGPKFKCPHCNFTTNFRIVLQGHLEVPHTNAKREYLCNWCEFKHKSADQIITHYLHNHKRLCRIEEPLPIHICRLCPFETNSKRRMASHYSKCEVNFQFNSFQGPQDYGEDDFPGVTSRLITQDDIQAYERVRNSLVLSSYNPHHVKVSGLTEHGEQRQVIIVPSRYSPNLNHVDFIARPVNSDCTIVCNPLQQFAKNNSRQNNRLKKSAGIANQSRLLALLVEHNQPLSNRPSVLQHPRSRSLYTNGKSAVINAAGVIMAPAQQNSEKSGQILDISGNSDTTQRNESRSYGRSSTSNGDESTAGRGGGSRGNRASASKRSDFIICEICDTYTQDLSDLKTHMMTIHEMKMQKKSLEGRPPLSCQKCKWRFFTDQGLERHLLGVHCIVTSNVQTLVDQGKDSGRCTVCGKALANKLVAHMKEIHKANLKLAHLSYKCTICTATFNLYRHFENHVISVHPESVKRVSRVE